MGSIVLLLAMTLNASNMQGKDGLQDWNILQISLLLVVQLPRKVHAIFEIIISGME